MSEKRAYGKGLAKSRDGSRRANLAAVLQISEEGVGQLAEAKTIALERIRANPDQPRRSFDDGTLRELADSIRARGILQPIRVRRDGTGFQIIAGERRFRAAHLVGLREVPAVVVEQGADEAYIDALIENVQREDLNPLDRADALRRLRVNLGLRSWEETGAVLGMSRQSVYNLLGLEELPSAVREDLRSGGLTEKHGRALRQLKREPALQDQAYRTIVEQNLSGDESLSLVRELRHGADAAVDSSMAEPVVELAREIDRLTDRIERCIDAGLGAERLHAAREALDRVAGHLSAARGRLAE